MLSASVASIVVAVCIVLYVRAHLRALRRAQTKLEMRKEVERQAAEALAKAQMALAPRAVEEVKVETSMQCVIPWTEVQLQNVMASGSMGRIFRASLLSSFKAGGYVVRRLNVPVLNLHSHTEWVQHVNDLHKLEHRNVLQVLSLATDGMRKSVTWN